MFCKNVVKLHSPLVSFGMADAKPTNLNRVGLETFTGCTFFLLFSPLPVVVEILR